MSGARMAVTETRPGIGIQLSAHALSGLVRVWMRTLDYRVEYEDYTIDPIFSECRGPNLYLFWHEYILFPLYLRGHCHLTMLVSRHRDADLLTEVARIMGFRFIRGSSRRGGDQALRALLEVGKSQHLTITPDGPRGPRRQMAPGAVFLASRLQIPIVLMGFGYHRPWRLKSWDRFAIPRPFSRARAITSRAINIPPDLDRDGMEFYRQTLEKELNELTSAAEHWAENGQPRERERALYKAPAAHPPGIFPEGTRRENLDYDGHQKMTEKAA